jgi:serpin B
MNMRSRAATARARATRPSVSHCVMVVAEDGIEAAATGIVIGDTGSEEPEPRWEFRLDRPFIVMIYDRPTDSVLFFGRVLDPRGD